MGIFRKNCWLRSTPMEPETVAMVTAPDPSRFTILRAVQHGNFSVVEVHYDGATNYDGKKVLVLPLSVGEVHALKELDPHFRHDRTSPIARFEPTPRGWNLALLLAQELARTAIIQELAR